MKTVSQAMLDGYAEVMGRSEGNLYDPMLDCACAMGCTLIGWGYAKNEIADRAYSPIGGLLKHHEAALHAANDALVDAGLPKIAKLNDGDTSDDSDPATSYLEIEDIAGILAAEGH